MNFEIEFERKTDGCWIAEICKLPKFLIILLAFIALCACEKNNASGDASFALAYAELRIATEEYGETEDGKALRFQILEKYGLSADSFEKKIEEIKKEPEKWLKFQKSVIVILDTIAKLDTLAK